MANYPWNVWIVIVGLGSIGAVTILPYVLSIQREKLESAPIPLPRLLVLSALQTIILIALATGVGLLAARTVGLTTPLFDGLVAGQDVSGLLSQFLLLAIVLGLGAGIAIMALERFIFAPRLPDALRLADQRVAAWKGFLASFYGGIAEEILMRLFLMSGLLWLLSLVWQTAEGLPTTGAFWTANVLAAVIFGLGHLPATRALTPLTPLIIIRAVVLNGLGGVIFGWLFWQYGLAAAMIAHFSADIILHVIAPHLLPQPDEAAAPMPSTTH